MGKVITVNKKAYEADLKRLIANGYRDQDYFNYDIRNRACKQIESNW